MDSAGLVSKFLVTSTRSGDAIWSMGVNSNDAKNFAKSHIEPVVGIGK
jgi:(2Fe-2S) ferredoxin